MTHLVAVAGAAPGAGKSTLCAGIVAWLRTLGSRVDHFREQEVLTRAEFAPLAEEFRSTSQVGLRTLLDTTVGYVDSVRANEFDVAVTDALVPFVPSLMGWGYREPEIRDFLRELAERISSVDVTIVYLDDDSALALNRAMAREGPAWLDWLLAKLGDYPVTPAIRDFDSACAYLRRERDVTLTLLAELPWRVITLSQPDPPSAEAVLELAQEPLARILAPR